MNKSLLLALLVLVGSSVSAAGLTTIENDTFTSSCLWTGGNCDLAHGVYNVTANGTTITSPNMNESNYTMLIQNWDACASTNLTNEKVRNLETATSANNAHPIGDASGGLFRWRDEPLFSQSCSGPAYGSCAHYAENLTRLNSTHANVTFNVSNSSGYFCQWQTMMAVSWPLNSDQNYTRIEVGSFATGTGSFALDNFTLQVLSSEVQNFSTPTVTLSSRFGNTSMRASDTMALYCNGTTTETSGLDYRWQLFKSGTLFDSATFQGNSSNYAAINITGTGTPTSQYQSMIILENFTNVLSTNYTLHYQGTQTDCRGDGSHGCSISFGIWNYTSSAWVTVYNATNLGSGAGQGFPYDGITGISNDERTGNIVQVRTIQNYAAFPYYGSGYATSTELRGLVVVPSGNEVNVKNESNFTRGQQYILGCQADGINSQGSWLNSSTLTIQNTPPNATDIIPKTVSGGLNCTYNYADYDADAESGSSYRWFKNGNLNASITNRFLGSGNYTGNDQLICEVTPKDGTDNGTATNSSTYVNGDTTPPTCAFTIIPASSTILAPTTLQINTTDANSFATGYPKIQWTNPNSILEGNFSMSSVGGNLYEKSYTFSIIGTYTNLTAFCVDGSGNSNQTSSTGLSISSGASSGAGGGAPPTVIIQNNGQNTSYALESGVIDKYLLITDFTDQPTTFKIPVTVTKLTATCTAEAPVTCAVIGNGTTIELTYRENSTDFFTKSITTKVTATSAANDVARLSAQFHIVNLAYSVLGPTSTPVPSFLSDFPYLVQNQNGTYGGIRIIAILTIATGLGIGFLLKH